MTVYFFPFSPNEQTASVRYRGVMVLEALERKYRCRHVVFFPGLKTAFQLMALLVRLLFCRDHQNVYVFQKICKRGIYFQIIRFVLKRVDRSFYDIDDAVYISEDETVVRYLAERVKTVITGSQTLKTWALTHNPNVEFITTMLPVPEPASRTSNTTFTIGWIGKFHHHENDLLEVFFPALRALDFDFRLILIGIQNPADQQIIKDALKKQTRGEIEFVQIGDWSDEDLIVRNIRRFDVGVMPLQEDEFSLCRSAFKLKQYSSCGVPALVTPVGDTEEFLVEGENGWVCRSMQDWKEKLNHLFELSREGRDQLAASAYQCGVNGPYALPRNIDRYAGVFLDLDARYEVLRSCPACGSDSWALEFPAQDLLHHQPGTFYLSRCMACETRFQNPRIRQQFIHEFYPDEADYYNYAFTGGFSKSLRTMLKYAEGYFPEERRTLFGKLVAMCLRLLSGRINEPTMVENGRLLELGCGNGSGLIPYLHAGWTVKGYDFQESAVRSGVKHGLDLSERNLGDAALFKNEFGSYDVVRLMMVLEHVYDQHALLQLCGDLLKSGGQLILNVPVHAGSAKWFGPDAYSLQLPTHIVFLPAIQLKKLLLETGFSNVRISREYSRRDFQVSLSYRMRKRPGMNAVLNRTGIAAVMAMAYACLARFGISSRIRVKAVKV